MKKNAHINQNSVNFVNVKLAVMNIVIMFINVEGEPESVLSVIKIYSAEVKTNVFGII